MSCHHAYNPMHEACKIFIRSISISHVVGKDRATADVLSRAPVSGGVGGLQEEEIELYVDSVIASLPGTETRLREIQKHQGNDTIFQQLSKFCTEGWPDKFSIDRAFQPYLWFSGDLTVQKGLLP